MFNGSLEARPKRSGTHTRATRPPHLFEVAVSQIQAFEYAEIGSQTTETVDIVHD